jgi:hypothetical protein
MRRAGLSVSVLVESALEVHRRAQQYSQQVSMYASITGDRVFDDSESLLPWEFIKLISVCDEPVQTDMMRFDGETTIKDVKERIAEITRYPEFRIRVYQNDRALLHDETPVCMYASLGVLFYDRRHWIDYSHKEADTSTDSKTVTFFCETQKDDVDDLTENPVIYLSFPVNHGCRHLVVTNDENKEERVFKQGRCWSDAMRMYYAIAPVYLSKYYKITGQLITLDPKRSSFQDELDSRCMR